jgi:3-oxoacyl-[acyl-carrier protein] reductase
MDSDALDAFRLDDKVAVVTGGASGIGEAAAELFALAGAAVVIGDIDAVNGGETATRIKASGGSASFLETDVTTKAGVDALVDGTMGEHGRIDVMCNVAGAMFPGLIEDLDEASIDAGIALNLKSVIYGCQAATTAMRSGDGGSIINVSSGAIDAPYEGIGVYAFTKAAVAMLTMTLAKEVGPHGIRVNAIAPGTTLTKFTTWRLHREDGTLDQEAYDQFVEFSRQGSPIGRVGEAIDQAYLMLYLASDAGRFVTGNIHRSNGGQTMAW